MSDPGEAGSGESPCESQGEKEEGWNYGYRSHYAKKRFDKGLIIRYELDINRHYAIRRDDMDWKTRRFYELSNKRHGAYPLKYYPYDIMVSGSNRLHKHAGMNRSEMAQICLDRCTINGMHGE